MDHLSNDHKDRPNQHKNSHKLCDETGHLTLHLVESQWKLRQQHDQIFPMEGKPLEQILALEGIDKSKRAGLLESQSGIKLGKLIIRVRSFEITRSTSSG